MKSLRIGILLLLTAIVPGAQARLWDVSIESFAFVPQNITVTQGDSVRWTNNDGAPHTVTADGGAFGSGTLSPGMTFVNVFGDLGSFAYHCAIHTFMTGSVTVQAGPVITITEVMYDDTVSTDLEWAEIHNTTGMAIDISGWILSDNGTYPGGTEGSFRVPAATSIAADQYLVLCKLAIPEFEGEVVCTEYDASWTLGNSGDNLALFTDDSTGTLVDGSLSVQYPDLAAGAAGNSIEKCDPTAGWTGDPTAWIEATTVFATTGRYRHCTPNAPNSPCEADTEPPTLVSAQAANVTNVDVVFSESLDPLTATTTTNYSVDNGVGNPASVTLLGGNASVRLTFAADLTPNLYTLTVNNVEDVAGNVILPNSQIQFEIQAITEDLRFTEFMPNPNFTGTGDSLGEWFEIYNAGGAAVDLTGWIIQDNSGSDTIESASIAAGQYFVFCSNGDSATNGGVPENYAYEFGTFGWGISLNNTGELITIRNATGFPVSSLSYAGFPFAAGVSAQLRNLTDDPTVPANWCAADTIWNGATSGDHGTPGAASICPPDFVPDTLAVCQIREQDACGVPTRLGDRVVTRAVVTRVDTCRPIAYIESEACAVAVFGSAVMNIMQGHTRRMDVGDSIMIDGYLTQFRGLTEFSTFANFTPVVTYLGTRPVPALIVIPCGDIASNGPACAGEQYESRHVQVQNVVFQNGGGTFSHGDSNYVALCGGTDTIFFRVDSCDATLGTTIPTGPVTINAIATQYDTSAACLCDAYQLVYGGGQTFESAPCVQPTELTVYRTALNISTESVELRWAPGPSQPCTCYKIYYTENGAGVFPGDYTLLTCVCDVTTYTDIAPISTVAKRFYVVTADVNCE